MIKPVNKYILVEPISVEKKGSMFIPIANALPYKKGLVKAISDQVTQCKIGDTVVFMKRIVAEVEENKVEHFFISEESLMYIES